METEYFRIFMENVSAWPVLAAIVLIWLMLNPAILERITSLKVGNVEVQLKEMQEHIEELENELSRQEQKFLDDIDNIDANASVSDLGEVRAALKASARGLDGLDSLKQLLGEEATAEEIYAAAVALRERPTAYLFGDAINCLERLANDKNLKGLRLNFVWTLTSAIHRILLDDIKHSAYPTLQKAELLNADRVLSLLEQNARVQKDRPDNPRKGILGPIKFSKDWISKGLKKLS